MLVPAAVIASSAAGSVTTLGILAVHRRGEWARANSTYFACFAAGVLIAVSFLHLVPKSLELSGRAPFLMLAGYLLLHAFNRFVTSQVCDKPTISEYALGLVPMFGIALHSLVDGVIYSVTLTVDAFTGWLGAAGMVLHEFPEGSVTYVLLLRSGIGERGASMLAFISAAVTTPPGTLVSCRSIAGIHPSLLASLLVLSAGALFYVGATHLLPLAEREPRRNSMIALGAGIATALGVIVAR